MLLKVYPLLADIMISKRNFKKMPALACLAIAAISLCLCMQLSYAQFMPCRIVNLNLIPPTLVQTGQPFQVTSNLTASCDPSVLPVVRVDLVDAGSSRTLATTSLPYYPSSSSFTVSVVSQATARQALGSWALQVQAYVINGINGQSAASASQLFQVNVEPYTSPLTATQTAEATTQNSNASSVSTQVLPTTTNPEVITEALSPTLTFNTQATSSATGELVLPATIVLLGIAVFGLLVFEGNRRRRQHSVSNNYCGQCGAELSHGQNYCPSCGARQTK